MSDFTSECSEALNQYLEEDFEVERKIEKEKEEKKEIRIDSKILIEKEIKFEFIEAEEADNESDVYIQEC